MKVILLNENEMNQNTYVVLDNDECYLIDPGMNLSSILQLQKEKNLLFNKVLLTHGHFDHIRALEELSKKTDLTVYIHEDDYPMLFDNSLNLARLFKDSFQLKKNTNIVQVKHLDTIGSFIVHHTPGHTKGSVCIEISSLLFSGDTLFRGSIGRTDLVEGDEAKIQDSLQYLLKEFKNNVRVLPGHDEPTTIKEEKKENKYIITKKERRKKAKKEKIKINN